MRRKSILFIASHRRDRAPGQRFRFEQYFEYLQEHGFDCALSPIVDAAADRILYRPGHYAAKFGIQMNSLSNRWADVRRAKDFDIIFIFREALMMRSTYFEKRFKASGSKLVFDFDDAIWKLDVSAANRHFGWLKHPGKTADIIAMCDLVFAGNGYLADYARRYNAQVAVIPTTIDTEHYRKRGTPGNGGGQMIIGWTGSLTTIKHFEHAIPILRELKNKYGERIAIRVIGDDSYRNAELGIHGLAWNASEEITHLSGMDIGIMPLPDDEWTKGKCGLKGLQYMALGIPTIMSPVGVNTEIIRDGVNGFLASAVDEWVAKISRLIDSPLLRQSIGDAARHTVEERYSVKALRGEYLRRFTELIEE